MGSTDIANLLGCNHATIIHGNKVMKHNLSVMSSEYIVTLNNWRSIFEKHDLEVKENTTTKGVIKNRMIAALRDGITENLIDAEDIGDMLIDLLRKFAPEYVQEDE